jgi:flagellar biosynthesis/type III secretory pathway M-ring protein FliF/YscJ
LFSRRWLVWRSAQKNKMKKSSSRKNIILIGIPTTIITASIIISCWIILSKNAFFIVLSCLMVFAIVIEPLVNIYEGRKKNKDEKGEYPKNT